MEAGQQFGAVVVGMRKAEAAFAKAERLDAEAALEALGAREAAENRKEPPSGLAQLKKAYKCQLAMVEARLQLSEAKSCAAEAEAVMNCKFWLAEELETARLKRALWRYTRKCSVCSSVPGQVSVSRRELRLF